MTLQIINRRCHCVHMQVLEDYRNDRNRVLNVQQHERQRHDETLRLKLEQRRLRPESAAGPIPASSSSGDIITIEED